MPLLLPPRPSARTIDVCNIGRRSPVTHEGFLDLARQRRIFYFYDTVRASGPRGKQLTFHVGNAADHRLLLANVLRRTRFFLAYRGRVNEPEQTEGREEISGRFYEGAAAGAVLLGEPPRSEEFDRQFDWTDAVVRLPFDAPDVGEFLVGLDRDPARLERIRRTNARQAALRHDWLHRIESVFKAAGLPPTRDTPGGTSSGARPLAARGWRAGPARSAPALTRSRGCLRPDQRRHLVGQRQHCGQAGRFDSVEVNQPGTPCTWAVDHEVGGGFVGPVILGRDARVPRLEPRRAQPAHSSAESTG